MVVSAFNVEVGNVKPGKTATRNFYSGGRQQQIAKHYRYLTFPIIAAIREEKFALTARHLYTEIYFHCNIIYNVWRWR
jgi:hypothetical protein